MLETNQNTTQTKPSNPFEGREGLVYARVSSKRQETEGSGLESQEGRCINELKALKIPHTKTFPDSFSGGGDFMNRPAMREMLAYIDTNPHKKFAIVFDDLKRFARDAEFHLKLRRALKARDVELRCLNFNFDESPEGKFAELIMAGSAELEREQNKRQVVQKQKARLEKGYWAFGSKSGYQQTKDNLHGMLSIPNKKGLEILKPAMEMFAIGTLARKIDVCEYLVGKGFWGEATQRPEKYIDKVTKMFKDPFYAGYVEYIQWEVSRRKGHHEGIISLEIFDLIQKRLRNDGLNRRIRKDMSDDLPLRGLLVCALCNQHLTGAGSTSRGKRYFYYNCQNKACELRGKSIPVKTLQKDFEKLLKKTTLKKDVSSLVGVMFDRVWDDEVDTLKRQELAQERRKDDLSGSIKHLSILAGNAKLEAVREGYEMQIGEAVTELKKIQEQLPLSETDLNIPYRNALDKAVGLLKSPYTYWQKLGLLEQHSLFLFIFEQKLPYHAKEGYRNAEELSTARLFETFATANTSDVEMRGIEPRCNRYASNESTTVAKFCCS